MASKNKGWCKMIGARRLNKEEIEKIKSKLNTRDAALFVFGVRTGFRINEALLLSVADVFDGKSVLDSVKVTKSKMKGKIKSRTVPLHEEARVAIAKYLEEQPVRSLEYPLWRTNPVRRMDMSTFHKALKKACALSGVSPIGVSSHSMRKCYAANMFEALDQNIFKVQKAMGHASPNSTCAYLTVDTEEIEDAIRNAK